MSEFVLHSAAETEALGAALGRALASRTGVVIGLDGDLGAGKTTLARGLLRALGVTGAIRSPTYTLMEPYEVAGRTVLHMDLYRLSDAREVHALGLADFAPDRCWWLVEWPGRGAGVLPPWDLRIELAHDPRGRRARVSGPLASPTLLAALSPSGQAPATPSFQGSS